MNCNKERPVTTSIGLENSKLQEIKRISIEKGYKSRNELIYEILTNWLEKEKEA